MSSSLQVNVMSAALLLQDLRFDVLINCYKVQMTSLISISHFSYHFVIPEKQQFAACTLHHV